MATRRTAEGAAPAVLGGALAALATTAGTRRWRTPWARVVVAAGVIAATANGALSGARRTYAWRTPRGALAFVLDSTWSLPNTAVSLVAHVGAQLRGDPQYAPALSERRNRHVYGRGLQLRRGFAITLGNVVAGAGDVTNPRRAKLVTDHEDVHVWQARTFGPAFLPLYLGSMLGGGAVGVAAGACGRGRVRELAETCGYYLNPFEYWAYCRDGNWPPRGIAAGVAPRRPVVASFAALGRPRA